MLLDLLKRKESGQITVEFVAVFPVMIIVALVAMNAILFFSQCAAFDRTFRESVNYFGTSPGYGEGSAQAASKVQANLEQALDASLVQVSVSAHGGASGLSTYKATMRFQPTLFGQGSISSVFGVGISPLQHEAEFVVDAYKPGVLL